MATKIKAPPKSNGGEVLAMLKLTKNSQTSGYAAKMSNLLNFLNLTSGNRISAEVVETDISIEQDGGLVSFKRVRQDFINDKMSKVHFLVKEENEVYGKLNEIFRQLSECTKVLRSKAKANTDEKKEKAMKKSDELQVSKNDVQSELNELRGKIEGLKDAKRKELEATDFPIQEMRVKLELLTGCKIKIDLTTGSYTFPVPTGTPFYREVCRVLGLPMEHQEVEKVVIKKTFTLPPEVLEAVRKALKFVSTDDLRPAMTGVSMEFKGNKLVIVATDAHRLYKSPVFKVSGPPGEHNYILPRAALNRLPKIIDEDFGLYVMKDGTVSMLGLTIKPIDARFPNWRVVVPEYKTGVTFNREDFIHSVKNMIPFTNRSTCQVNIDINGALSFAADDRDFKMGCETRMAYKKKDMPDTVIGFNGKFLVEALSIFKSEDITMLSEGGPSKAAIISDGTDTVLVMPLCIGHYR